MSNGVSADEARTNLDKVDHIIVMMMENRSFDHILGYLSLQNRKPGVNGLQLGMGNEDLDGVFREVRPMGERRIDKKYLDPGHSFEDIDTQIAGNMGGFVRNYTATFQEKKQRGRVPQGFVFDPTLVIGYQTATDVPVYDYLAQEFCVCDRWFSSVPAATWPNRLYAVSGGSGGELTNRHPPIYDRGAFVRHLEADDVPWRWYSHDPGTLRLIDQRYQLGYDREFAYFNRKSLFERRTFLDDAANGELPCVSWIDPNFVDFRLYGPPGSNDDHPPSHVMAGQELVLSALIALMSSPQWPKTLLIITYDEHGGFFDHVDPRECEPEDDDVNCRQYGVRVPALVVSPFIDPAVSHQLFDHTSIIKTILLRFCQNAEGAIAAMGARVASANHIGELLTRAKDQPRKRPPQEELDALIAQIAAWRMATYEARLLEEPTPGEQLFEALTDLQGEIVTASLELRRKGLQAGKP
jgi:phospholipase C